MNQAQWSTQELLVLSDSRFGKLQRLHFDWFQAGGLLRPVEAPWEAMGAGDQPWMAMYG